MDEDFTRAQLGVFSDSEINAQIPEQSNSECFTVEMKRLLGSGVYGKTYISCFKNGCDSKFETGCNYAAKVVDLTPERGEFSNVEGISLMDAFTYEVMISRLMSRIGVGPKVYEVFITRTVTSRNKKVFGIIIMEKLHMQTAVFSEEQMESLIFSNITPMHEAGVFHGDLHGENVMVTKDGDPRLIDFGIALYFPSEYGVPFRVRKDEFEHLYESSEKFIQIDTFFGSKAQMKRGNLLSILGMFENQHGSDHPKDMYNVIYPYIYVYHLHISFTHEDYRIFNDYHGWYRAKVPKNERSKFGGTTVMKTMENIATAYLDEWER